MSELPLVCDGKCSNFCDNCLKERDKCLSVKECLERAMTKQRDADQQVLAAQVEKTREAEEYNIFKYGV